MKEQPTTGVKEGQKAFNSKLEKINMKNLVSQISSSHLTMRMLDTHDANVLQKLLEENKQYMLPWIPWAADEPESVEIKKEKIRTWKGEFYLDQTYTYGIFKNGNDQLIGLIFLFTRQGKGTLEIGYIIDQKETGKGYATESSYAVTKLGFKHIGIEKMVIHCSPNNEPSVKIPMKLGFQLEGTYRSPDEMENGQRKEMMIWVMFIEEFETIDKYEPITFQVEE